MRLTLTIGAVAAAVVLTSGCAYRAGTASAEKFDSWVKDNPIRGARIVDSVGTDIYAFTGKLTAYARLTAEPTDTAIKAAMTDLCAFDEVSRTPATYWLQVERISMQVICTADGRDRLAGFYDATKDLTTLDQVFLDRTGVVGQAPDGVVPVVAQQVFAAADASGTVGADATYVFEGKRVRVEAGPELDLTGELAAARDVLPVVGDALSKLKVVQGLVVTETTGGVGEARQWQSTVAPAAGVTLLVTPARITSDTALSLRARALAERLSTDERVSLVSFYPDHWVIDVADLTGGRALLESLASEPSLPDLGELTLQRAADDTSCYVVVRYTEAGRSDGSADAALDLCAREDMPMVDNRFGFLSVRTTGDDLRAVLVAAKAQPPGTKVSIDGPAHYEFTTGPTLTFDNDFVGNQALQDLWATLR